MVLKTKSWVIYTPVALVKKEHFILIFKDRQHESSNEWRGPTISSTSPRWPVARCRAAARVSRINPVGEPL